MGKWTYLRDQLPLMQDDEDGSSELLKEQLAVYRGLDMHQIAETYNDLEEELSERNAEVKELKTKRKAAEIVLAEKMKAAGQDSVVMAGYRWTPGGEPYPKIVDRAALLEWALKHMKDNLRLHDRTLQSTLKHAIEMNEPYPDGVEPWFKPSFSRTKQGA